MSDADAQIQTVWADLQRDVTEAMGKLLDLGCTLKDVDEGMKETVFQAWSEWDLTGIPE